MTLWNELRKNGVTVQPVVVLWGGEIRKWDEERRCTELNDVPVLAGPGVSTWIRSLPDGVLDPTAVDDVWAVIEVMLVCETTATGPSTRRPGRWANT